MRLPVAVFTYIVVLFFSISLSSCKKEKVDPFERFYGLYMATEECQSGGDAFEIIITKSNGQLLISNLYDVDIHVKADVNNNNFTIPQQTVTNRTSTSYVISGAGSINNNTISIEYTIKRGEVSAETCKLQGVRK